METNMRINMHTSSFPVRAAAADSGHLSTCAVGQIQ